MRPSLSEFIGEGEKLLSQMGVFAMSFKYMVTKTIDSDDWIYLTEILKAGSFTESETASLKPGKPSQRFGKSLEVPMNHIFNRWNPDTAEMCDVLGIFAR